MICSCTVRYGLHLRLEPFSGLCDININAYNTHKSDIPDIQFAFRRVTDGGDGASGAPIIAIA